MDSAATLELLDAAATRRRLATDPHRPRYHFLPPANWLNDPNGLIHWRGQYHLFYQYNPGGPQWGDIHWGHAASPDLVHWRDLPIALAPSPGGPDAGGCWSGCAFDNNGTPTILYTGGNSDAQLPCLAVSHDDLLSFEKSPANPVIPAPPAGLDLVGFRDHSVWREDGQWYQVIGAGVRGEGGAALLYRSPDLVQWEYLGPLFARSSAERDPLWTGEMWECPSFFPLGDRHVLIVSVFAEDPVQFYYPIYFVGTYADGRFTPEHMGLLDLGGHVALGHTAAADPRRQVRTGMRGGHCYAPQTFEDEQGRRLLLGWLMEGRSEAAQIAAGWSGVVSLPRVLTLAADGTLRQTPATELRSLRGDHVAYQNTLLSAGHILRVEGIPGTSFELLLEVEPGSVEQIVLAVGCSPDGAERTEVRYDTARGYLTLDGTRSSRDAEALRAERGGPFALVPGEPLRLHIFVDGSVVEVFANERACLSGRIYPTRADSCGIELTVRGGAAVLIRLDAWKLDGIWEAAG
jgi:beta-fructofuranosidase